MRLPPFPPEYRASDLLLHVTSLPSRYGIGDLGPAAVAWIDRLHEAGQSWWQSLPLGPTGYGDSPYQSLSSFAGNPLLISPDWLIEDELVKPSDVAGGQAHWLDDYALFRALKVRYGDAAYLDWPDDLVRRTPAALDRARRDLASPVDPVRFGQFLLFHQGARLKSHARAKGVRLIGDLPFFVSPDSSDVWAHPELFLLDARHRPRVVAGVPPDYFSAQGQRWGNPIYDWNALAARGYRWCIDRLGALLAHVDAIRLDHFRAFAAAWHIPAGAPTAQSGQWLPGPGADFFVAVEKAFGGLPFLAEDLGLITPDVIAVRDAFHVPGTRVLQFAFDGHSDNPYLPNNYVPNTVVYTGTHDNPTTRGWYEDLPDSERGNLWRYLERAPGKGEDAAPALLRLAWSSAAALEIAPLQDVLNLGKEARMNRPGSAEGNWRWRCTDQMLSDQAFQSLRDLTQASARVVGSLAAAS
jgi:4-alpha-glucanotransferase